MSGLEHEKEASQQLEIPIITEDFLDAFHSKFPSHDSRYPVIGVMDQRLREKQPALYAFVREEAARALVSYVGLDQFPAAMRRLKFPIVDIYTALCEQKQFNNGEYTRESIPDETRIVRVTPRAIARYDRQAIIYVRQMAEGTGEVLGPIGKMLTYLHINNPFLQGRISQLLASRQPEYRVSGIVSTAMLAVIATQVKQAPFNSQR